MFMLKEHIKNIKNEITEYKKAMDDDFTFKEEKGDQAGGPETRSAILQLISENASITSREMANKLGINRSILRKCKTTTSFTVRVHRSPGIGCLYDRIRI